MTERLSNNIMDDRLKNIEKNISHIKITLVKIDKTLALNTKELEEHMRRTALLEEEVRPVVKHVEQVRGAGKLLAILATIAGILAAWAVLR